MPARALSPAQRTFVADARRATLATLDPAGRPRLVPICFVLDPESDVLYTPLDDKPKRSDDPMRLARVRDIAERPAVGVLVDRWDEDWSRLAWVRLDGEARLIDAHEAPAGTIDALRGKYPQYASHRLEDRPLIAVSILGATSWSAR